MLKEVSSWRRSTTTFLSFPVGMATIKVLDRLPGVEPPCQATNGWMPRWERVREWISNGLRTFLATSLIFLFV